MKYIYIYPYIYIPIYPYSPTELFHQIIRYIIGGTIDITGDNVADLLQLGSEYNLQPLVVLASQYMQSGLELDTVCAILEHADRYETIIILLIVIVVSAMRKSTLLCGFQRSNESYPLHLSLSLSL